MIVSGGGWSRSPAPNAAFHRQHQRVEPGRADELHGIRFGRELSVPPRVDQRRQVGRMVGVEVRVGDVGDVLPANSEFGHARHDCATAIDEELYSPDFDQGAALNPACMRGSCSRADGCKAHTTGWRRADGRLRTTANRDQI
jgi:hypothetical protein